MTYEEIFAKNFIKKEYQNRIIYELLSPKDEKREKAFTKLSHRYDEFINSNCIAEDISHLEDSLALKAIKEKIKEKVGYSLKTKEKGFIEDIFKNSVNSCMMNVIVINEREAIYIGEVFGNNSGGTASKKYILKKIIAH